MNQTPNSEFFDNKDHDHNHHPLDQADVSSENHSESIGSFSQEAHSLDSDVNDSTGYDDEQYLTTDANMQTTATLDDTHDESDETTGEIQQIINKNNNNIFTRQRQFDPDAAMAIPLISIPQDEESYDASVFEVDLHEQQHSVNNNETSSVGISSVEYEAGNSTPKLAFIEKYFSLKKSAPKTYDSSTEVLETAVRLKYVDPLSVSKISASIGVTMGFIWVLAIGLLYLLLDIFSVFDKINTSFSGANKAATTVIVSPSGVLLFSIISGFLVALFVTITSTLGAVIYNILAEFFGGILITLADDPKNKL